MKIAKIIVYTGSKFMLKETVKAPSLFTISIVTKKANEVQIMAKNKISLINQLVKWKNIKNIEIS